MDAISTTPATDEEIAALPMITEYITFLNTVLDGTFIKEEDINARPKRDTDSTLAVVGKALRGLPKDDYEMPVYAEGQAVWTNENTITDEEGFKRLSHMTLFDKYGVNVVHKNATHYFYENILYYTSQDIMTLFKLTYPVLTETRKEIVEPIMVKAWYVGFARGYFALALAESGSTLAPKVNKEAVKEYMTMMMTSFNHSYTHQTKALFDYSFVQQNRWMEMFLKDKRGPKFWAKIYSVYLKKGPFLKDFLAWNHDKTSRAGYHAALQNIKATLDVLDPSTNSSRDVVFYLNYMTVYYYIADKFHDTKIHEEIMNDTIAAIFNKIVAKEAGDGFEPVLRDFIGAFANANAAMEEIQRAIRVVQYTSFGRPNIKNGIDAFTKAYVKMIVAQLKVKLPNFVFTQRFKYYLVTMFRCAHVVMIGYAIYNKDALSTYQKGYFAAEGVGALIDTAVMVGDKMGTDFVKLSCIWFNKNVLLKYTPLEFATRCDTGFKFLFTADASTFILERFTPVMLAISAGKAFYDMVQDLKNDNIKALAFDGATFGVATTAVTLFVADISWSGPFALGAGITIALLGGIKYFVTSEDSADQVFFDKYLDEKFKFKIAPVEISGNVATTFGAIPVV
eukprot:gene8052-9461_t